MASGAAHFETSAALRNWARDPCADMPGDSCEVNDVTGCWFSLDGSVPSDWLVPRRLLVRAMSACKWCGRILDAAEAEYVIHEPAVDVALALVRLCVPFAGYFIKTESEERGEQEEADRETPE